MTPRTAAQTALGRISRVPPRAVDAVLATFFLVATVVTTAAITDGDVAYAKRDAVAWALILAATVPYYWRRRAPLAVFAVTATAVTLLMAGGHNEGILPFTIAVGLYTVAAYRPAPEVAASVVYLAALLVFLLPADNPDFGPGELVASAGLYGMATLIGWTAQSRRLRIDALEQEQREATLRAAADERLRIAQELHDVVGHSLGVIAIQAAVGMKVIDHDLPEARRSLDNISRTSRSSLAEIRRLLTAIRDDNGGLLSPAPRLADLPRMVQEVADTGLPVDLRIDGETATVPAGVGLAAYRIVQEALTNTLRHASAARATVHLAAASGALQIEVTDDGRGPSDAKGSAGHGLVGMRERAALYGGTVEAGGPPGGGFRVTARLRYDEEPVG